MFRIFVVVWERQNVVKYLEREIKQHETERWATHINWLVKSGFFQFQFINASFYSKATQGSRLALQYKSVIGNYRQNLRRSKVSKPGISTLRQSLAGFHSENCGNFRVLKLVHQTQSVSWKSRVACESTRCGSLPGPQALRQAGCLSSTSERETMCL